MKSAPLKILKKIAICAACYAAGIVFVLGLFFATQKNIRITNSIVVNAAGLFIFFSTVAGLFLFVRGTVRFYRRKDAYRKEIRSNTARFGGKKTVRRKNRGNTRGIIIKAGKKSNPAAHGFSAAAPTAIWATTMPSANERGSKPENSK
jgi:hypothetical protein